MARHRVDAPPYRRRIRGTRSQCGRTSWRQTERRYIVRLTIGDDRMIGRDRNDERARLATEIELARARVAALEGERERELQRIDALHLELDALAATPRTDALASRAAESTAPRRSQAEKLAIFCTL